MRFRKIIAISLAAALALPILPGSVHAAEAPNAEALYLDAGGETGGGEGTAQANGLTLMPIGHTHEWAYKKDGGDAVTATCTGVLVYVWEGSAITCAAQARLTLGMNVSGNEICASVQTDKEDEDADSLGIAYQIQYFDKEGAEMEGIPRENGKYKAQVMFGDDTSVKLEKEYMIIDGRLNEHTAHTWTYSQRNADTVIAACPGPEGQDDTCGEEDAFSPRLPRAGGPGQLCGDMPHPAYGERQSGQYPRGHRHR